MSARSGVTFPVAEYSRYLHGQYQIILLVDRGKGTFLSTEQLGQSRQMTAVLPGVEATNTNV